MINMAAISSKRRLLADAICELLKPIFPADFYSIWTVYNGSGIEVCSEEESTRVYLVLKYIGESFAADIEYISLASNKRHQGIFTRMFSALEKSGLEELREIRVSSVLSPEMENACLKMGMKPDKEINGFKKKI